MGNIISENAGKPAPRLEQELKIKFVNQQDNLHTILRYKVKQRQRMVERQILLL